MASKQADTIRERYGTAEDPNKFWREKGREGGKAGGGRRFRDRRVAIEAQKASVAARKAKKEAAQVENG